MMRGTLALLVSVLLIPHVVATQTNASRFAASQGSAESVRIPVEEASIAAGPLHGIPVIVKDNIDVAGLPMTSGFQGWKNYYPPADAPLVTKLRGGRYHSGQVVVVRVCLRHC